MNVKYEIKFHRKQPWQTRIECSRIILIPNNRHCWVDFGALSFSVSVWPFAVCNWHLLLCPVPVNLLSTFGTGSSTEITVPRNNFIFNYTLDVKPFKLIHCTCWRARAIAKFQLKSDEGVLEISESFFKHHTVFPLTLAVSIIFDRATIIQRKDFLVV